MSRDRISELRHRVYLVLEQGLVGDGLSIAVDRALVLLILINLIAVALELVPELGTQYRRAFVAIEIFSLVVFSIEYALRLWAAVEHGPQPPSQGAMRARLKYALSPSGIIDLIAVLPFWFALVLPDDLRLLVVFRIVRFFKIARYSPAMRSLLDVLYRERRALFGCLVITLGSSLVAAALMHLAEGKVQPDKLGTIPDALWWAIVTIGTIGYGDVVPVTVLGKFIATGTIFAGLIMMALPIGIIATAFAEQIHRRDFIVTWSMIARVPLFAELDAAAISDIMELLRAQVAESGEVIVRAGDPAHSMYFIAAGEVEVALKKERIRLGVGQFFGEVAVLRRARRSATATALTRTNLLVLAAQDLHALMQRNPHVAQHIKDVVEKRVGRERVSARGRHRDGGDRVALLIPPPLRGRVASLKRVYARLRRAMASRVGELRDRSHNPTRPRVARAATLPFQGRDCDAIAFSRFSLTLSRKPPVDSHFWLGPIRSARSLVMNSELPPYRRRPFPAWWRTRPDPRLVAGGDAAEVRQFVEEALNEIALTIATGVDWRTGVPASSTAPATRSRREGRRCRSD